MKILITGTHCVGKSTLLSRLQNFEELKYYRFIGGVTRQIKEKGFEINESGDWKTQLYCISIDIQNILSNEHENIVYDRSVIDTYIYTRYLYVQNINNIYLHKVTQLTYVIQQLLKDQFDIVLWLRPEFELVDDGVRSQNKDFQKDIDLMFEEFFVNANLKNVYTLKGSVEERLKYIKRILHGRTYIR